MKFQVSPKEGSSHILSVERLLELIFKNSLDINKKEEQNKLLIISDELSNQLLKTKSLLSFKLKDIIVTSFTVGYYYSQFLNKNNVKIIEE